MSVKVYKGGSYVDMSYLRRYNGNSWIDIAGGNEFVRKELTVRSSTSKRTFIDSNGNRQSFYSLEYNEPLGFTPASFIAYNDDSSSEGVAFVFNLYPGLGHWIVAGYYPLQNPQYVQNNTAYSWLNSNGFLVPVHRYNRVYKIWLTGYK